MANFTLIFTLIVVALAIFIMFPAPELSPKVTEWKKSGQSFQHNGHNVFYHDVKGSGLQDDVLVIFHGYPTSSFDFIQVWDELLQKFGRVIVPDFLGFGLSDKPVGYEFSVMDMANLVEALLKHLKVKSFHVLSHDLGDTVAQELIARYNEAKGQPKLDMQSVCLLNGGILPENHEPRLTQKLLLNPYSAPIVMRLMNYRTFRKALCECFGSKTQPTEEDLNDHWALIRYNDGHLVQYGLIQYIHERFANRERWVGALQETKLPLHLIYGPSDPVNPPTTFLARYKKLIPNSGITELPTDRSHYPHAEDPQGVLEAYFKFLDSLQAGKKQDS